MNQTIIPQVLSEFLAKKLSGQCELPQAVYLTPRWLGRRAVQAIELIYTDGTVVQYRVFGFPPVQCYVRLDEDAWQLGLEPTA